MGPFSKLIPSFEITRLAILILNVLAEPCDAGKYLDPDTGCQTCDADTYSPANNKLAKCIDCPAGKEVAAGTGTQESDCKWSELKIY